MMENKINHLWSTPVLRKPFPQHGRLKSALFDFTQTYMEDHKQSRESAENVGLFESEYRLFDHHAGACPALGELAGFLATGIGEIASAANEPHWHNDGIELADMDVVLRESWFINYRDSGFVLPHTHSGSWSCVYYLQMNPPRSPNDGATYFLSPINRISAETDFGNSYVSNQTVISGAREGDALFFPAHILHGSYPHAGNSPRIVFSANAAIVRK